MSFISVFECYRICEVQHLAQEHTLFLSLQKNCKGLRSLLVFGLLQLEETLFTKHVIGKWLKTFLSCTNMFKLGHCNSSKKTFMLVIEIEAHLLTSADTVSVVLLNLIKVWVFKFMLPDLSRTVEVVPLCSL